MIALLVYNSHTIQFVHLNVQFNNFGTFTQLCNYHQKDISTFLGLPGGAVVETLPANAGDTGSSPGLGGSHMPQSD